MVTVEDGVRHGGAGAFLLDAMAAARGVGRPAASPPPRVLGVPRQYLAQGKADDILASLGLDGTGIAETIRRARDRRPGRAQPRLRPRPRPRPAVRRWRYDKFAPLWRT